ncbi:phenylacetate--CoA ligase family protein [Candidatus Bipolaricaulota bacterium]
MSLTIGIRRRLYDAGLVLSGLGPAKAHYRAVVDGDLDKLVAQQTRAILQHAASQVPYYQRLGTSEESLDSFPILSRETIRQRYRELKSSASTTRNTTRISSGGSTGEPVNVLMDHDARQWDVAASYYFRRILLGIHQDTYFGKHKVALWDPVSKVSGRGTSLLLHLGRMVSRTTYLDPCVLSADVLSEYAQQINEIRPAFITAYSSSLYELAYFASRKGLRMHRPLMIFTSGNTLFPAMRSCIEQTFGCRVHDRYGSRENGFVAGECSHGRLHILSFNNVVEVVDDSGKPAPADQEGHVLATSLHNHAMPLIRYDTGDLASAGSGVCKCGSTLPFLNRITGRVVEHFPTSHGCLVTGGYFFHLFYGCSWIAEFQLLQEELDRVVVSYTHDPSGQRSDEDLERITEGIHRVMGHNCIVEWQEVDSIPRTRHGKRLFTRSLVWESQHPELLGDIAPDG